MVDPCPLIPFWAPYAALGLLLFGRWLERADQAWKKRNPNWRRGP